MNSSTSSSETSRTQAVLAFLITFIVIVVPYELAVRRAVRHHAPRHQEEVRRSSARSKIDGFTDELAGGNRFSTVVVGNSRAQNGFRPDVLDLLGGRAYNLSISAVSGIVGLELLQQLDAYPERLIVSVSPLDFANRAVERGKKALNTIPQLEAGPEDDGPGAVARRWTYAVFSGAARERRRNFTEWAKLIEVQGNAYEFLYDPEPGEYGTWIRGFICSRGDAPPDVFVQQPSVSRSDYDEAKAILFRRFESSLRDFQHRGTEVILVRVPTSPSFRRAENSLTFDADIRASSTRLGVAYIDGMEMMPPDFSADPRHFYDRGHLNFKGGTRFTHALVERLKRQSDHTPSGRVVARATNLERADRRSTVDH